MSKNAATRDTTDRPDSWSSPGGRRIAITGAASGIGLAAALAAIRAGDEVWALDRDEAALRSLASQVPDGLLHTVVIDVTDQQSIAAAFGPISESGGLDVLVNSAGIFPRARLDEVSLDHVARVHAVNFLGAVGCTLAARSALVARSGRGPTGGRSTIVFLTSAAALVKLAASEFQRGFAAYGASKAALDRWVVGVAPEFDAEGVLVSLLCPGAIVATPGVVNVLSEEERVNAVSPRQVVAALGELTFDRLERPNGARLLATDYGTVWGAATSGV
ncbi:SDR family NAD(P)-dependent oxidoreductase [Desertimonas flava]|uniref:SDR family NAD(P)-dependent oxidoreductase n=1 Tax=Desertimonas flava TaxID=2064846 RepID=UPI000E3430F0|nr:SDR family oxidoreductase [Desertimonas flava]